MFFHKMHQERFGRPVEDAIHKIAHHIADDFAARLRGAVNMRAVCLVLLQIFLLLQNFHHGHDSGVRDLTLLQQRFVNFADRDGVMLPDDLHDFEFLLGENGALATHTNYLVLCGMVLQAKSFAVRRRVPAIAILAAAFQMACGHPSTVFRLSATPAAPVLAPPGILEKAADRAVLRVSAPAGKGACAASPHGLTVQRLRSAVRVTVTRDAIAATTGAELFEWTVELEKQGCIAANEAFHLAENIVDALPLELARRRQLLQGRTDLRSVQSLNVVAPVMKPGAPTGALADVISTSEGKAPGSIDVEVKSNPAVIGYEVDWYDLVPRDAGPGFRIVPRSAETHVGATVEHPAVPTVSRFAFGPDARWYELFMMTKVSTNDFDFVVFSAPTPEELRRRDADFQRDAAGFLKTADPATYSVLPHGTGINAYMRVRVNGTLLDLPPGNSVQQAIRLSKAAIDPSTVLTGLKVQKLHDGKLYPVEWDHAGDQILSLTLEGGEEISW